MSSTQKSRWKTKSARSAKPKMEADEAVQKMKHKLQAADMNFAIQQEEDNKKLVELKLQNARAEAEEKGYAIATIMNGFNGVDPVIVQALATMGMNPNQLIAQAFQGFQKRRIRSASSIYLRTCCANCSNNRNNMNRSSETKIILVKRKSRLEDLLVRFNSASQAKFYIEHLGADFSDYQHEHDRYQQALANATKILQELRQAACVGSGLPAQFSVWSGRPGGSDLAGWSGGEHPQIPGRAALDRGQPRSAALGRDLAAFKVNDLRKIIPEVAMGQRKQKQVTLAVARLNNGQALYAVNDLFVGQRTHVSARYQIQFDRLNEAHPRAGSSSPPAWGRPAG